MKAKICVAIPLFGAMTQLAAHTAGSLFTLGRQLDVLAGDHDWTAGDVTIEPGFLPTNLVHARSNLVARFLAHKAQYSHMLMVDADTVASAQEIAHIITRMLKADRAIVGAPLVERHLFLERAAEAILTLPPFELDKLGVAGVSALIQGYAVKYVPDVSKLVLEIVDDVAEVPMVSLAFALVRRDVLEKMTKHYEGLTYERENADGSMERQVGLFAMPIEGRRLIDEDAAFCARWRAMGGRMHLYVGDGTPLGHLGPHVFRGTNEALRALGAV